MLYLFTMYCVGRDMSGYTCRNQKTTCGNWFFFGCFGDSMQGPSLVAVNFTHCAILPTTRHILNLQGMDLKIYTD